MKVEYCVEPTVDVFIDDKSETPKKLHIDDADVFFDISEDNLLKNLKVIFTGLPIKLEKRVGKIDLIYPTYPEHDEKAFKIISYVFNRIQGQTGQRNLDVNLLKDIQPDVSPETDEEIAAWEKSGKVVGRVFRVVHESVGSADFTDYEENFTHAKAYANFTDAKNTDDLISKYERLYKVVESFFKEKKDTGAVLDKKVAGFMVQFSSDFRDNHFKELRELRIRCVHPNPKIGTHISSGDIELLELLSVNMMKLERIAELLLKHN